MSPARYPKTSDAILAFFANSEIRGKHHAPELLDLYTPDMEVQINVAPDGGIEGSFRNSWVDPDDSTSDIWHNIRIPKNAKSEPERNDWNMKYDLAGHAEGIGCTGWDFGKRVSRWFGFDFDSIAGHKGGNQLSDEELRAVREAAWNVPWLEIRKSTGGKGLHLYIRCGKQGIPAANHTEHAALGRAILEKLSNAINFDFDPKVDCCGGNIWIWHRKITKDNEGLKLLKPATKQITAEDVPDDWRNHLPVVRRKRATQRVIGVPDEADEEFDGLVSFRKRVPFTAEHKRIMDALGENGFTMIYQRDNHLVQTHTARLAQLADDPGFPIKGIFKTISEGADPGTPNAFMFPLSNGGWMVHRFNPGTKETDTWDQSGYWTHCEFNVYANMEFAVKAVKGYETSKGSFGFDTVPQGLEAVRAAGIDVTAPDWTEDRGMLVERPRSRKPILSVDYDKKDENPKSQADMQKHGWHLEGKKANSKKWVQIVEMPTVDTGDIYESMLRKYDRRIRSLKTPDAQDAGWRIQDEEGEWVARNRTAVTDRLIDLDEEEPSRFVAKHQTAIPQLEPSEHALPARVSRWTCLEHWRSTCI